MSVIYRYEATVMCSCGWETKVGGCHVGELQLAMGETLMDHKRTAHIDGSDAHDG